MCVCVCMCAYFCVYLCVYMYLLRMRMCCVYQLVHTLMLFTNDLCL